MVERSFNLVNDYDRFSMSYFINMANFKFNRNNIMKEELTIRAEPKEITLIISIVNKIFNFKGEWNHISFFENNKDKTGSVMIPKGYFKGAEMKRFMSKSLANDWDICKKCFGAYKYEVKVCPMCKSEDIERVDNAGLASFFKLPLKDLFENATRKEKT